MSGEKNVITNPSITKVARTFNSLPIDATIQGMKTASFLEREIKEAEKEQEQKVTNSKEQETPIVTAQDIKDEMYR